MNWYKQQSVIRKESVDMDKLWKGFFAGTSIGLLGLAALLGLKNMHLQEIINNNGGNEQVVEQMLEQEVQKKAVEQGITPEDTQYDVVGEPEQATYDELENPQKNPLKFKQEPTKEKDFAELYMGRMSEREDVRTKAYNDGIDVTTIGIGHAMGKTPSDGHSRRSRAVFKKVFGNKYDWDKLYRKEQQLEKGDPEVLAEYDINDKARIARKQVNNFDSYPPYLQAALVDAKFRGDLGPKTIGLLNEGKIKAASVEYLNHHQYINAEKLGIRGIIGRMDENADAMRQYAKELGQ